MQLPIEDEITLELARLQRAALARVRERTAAQQLGEAWIGLQEVFEEPLQPQIIDYSTGRL